MYLLDTDTISYFLKGSSYSLTAHILECDFEDLSTTAINYQEISYGIRKFFPKKSKYKNMIFNFFNEIKVHAYTRQSALIYSEIKVNLEKKGTPVADIDLMIASIAIENKLTLVTNNTRHFQKIPGLELENWYVKDIEK